MRVYIESRYMPINVPFLITVCLALHLSWHRDSEPQRYSGANRVACNEGTPTFAL